MLQHQLTEQESKLYNILKLLEIEVKTFYHAPVTTVEEAIKVTKELDGINCKNLLRFVFLMTKII